MPGEGRDRAVTRAEFAQLWSTWQARYIMAFLYSLLPLELVDGMLRGRGVSVEMISMTMRRLAFSGMTAVAFFFGSMTVHWFVTWHRMTWDGPTAHVLGVFFWLVFAAYLAASWFDPTPRYWPLWAQWLRYPPVAALFGGLLAYVCFAQHSSWFPGAV